MDPIAERLELPDGYGRVTKTLAWATVRAALEGAMHYWVTTVRPDGRPHAVPVDGLWLDDAWFYGGSEQAVHYRNALASPRVVVHLPDPAKAVVVEGDVRLARPSPELARRLAEASRAKYGYGPTPTPTRACSACTRAGCWPGRRSPPTPPGSGSADGYGSASSSRAKGGSSTTSRKRPEATRPSTTSRHAWQHG